MAADAAAEIENDEGEGAGAPQKSKKKLVMIAGAALVLVLGGVSVAYVMFFKGRGEAAKTEHAQAHEPAPVFVDVPEVLVNLSNAPGERVQYLKVKVVLELPKLELADRIKPTMPRVMDTFQTYLRELRPEDLRGSAGLYRLREELTRRVNASIEPHSIKAVLFKEIMIQ